MTAAATNPHSAWLLRMSLGKEEDVVLCRNRARSIASQFRFDTQDQTRIATAVSEIARNAFRYGRQATAEFSLESALPTGQAGAITYQLVCTIRDKGPGIRNLDEVLSGRYKSTTGMGKGIIGAHRLMDALEFATGPKGTTARLVKALPKAASIGPGEIQRIADEVSKTHAPKPIEQLAEQNQEVLEALDSIRTKHEELSRIHEELLETNRGVVALYDELDTVSRIGREVATKLDFESLFQAITDATTDICGAELGAFFHEAPQGNLLIRQSVAGPLKDLLVKSQPVDLVRLFTSVSIDTVLRIDDLQTAGVGNPLGEGIPIRSYLAVPIFGAGGKVAGALVFGHRSPGIFSERSERILPSVAVQAAIGLDNAKLYHSVRAASAAKDQFLANLSHELRAPLSPVFAGIAILEGEAGLSEAARESLRVMKRNLRLETRLIDDLLDLTKITNGKTVLNLEAVDIHQVLRLTLEICAEAIAKKKVTVDLQLQAEKSYVRGDATRLQQVFWNLLSNAIKFTPEEGTIQIATALTVNEKGETCLAITLVDSGKGIDSQALLKIFQPFQQEDETVAAKFGGLGLGLAIAKSIIDVHDGDIRASSAGEGQGSTFTVRLPLTEAASPDIKPSRPFVKRASDKPIHILLVDDHDDTRATLKLVLTRKGFHVTAASSCQQAKELASKQSFELLISDLGLPDGTGHDLMRALHQTHGLAGIALSGYGAGSDVQQSAAAGFRVHLTKPLDIPSLEAAIEKTLGELY